ncbi:MAG: anti-sigma factor family protein, partial [Bacteroidota bacterium]
MKKDYFEYIMDYAAGELPPEHEDELFLAMQGDPELRDQFRDYLTLRRAASGASAHFAPPASSTMKIMNELGISAGAAGSSWAIGRFFSANRNMLIGSLAAAAITSMLFLLFYNPSREAIEKQEYASTQPISAQSFTEENPGNKYVDINSERKASKAIPTPEKSENIYIVQNHNNNEVNDQEIGDEEIAYNRIAEKSIGFMPENEQSALRLIKNDNAAEFDDVNEIEYEKPLRIDLFATGSIAGAFFLPPHTDNSADALSFADYDAGLFWKVSDGFAIGFEARREYFTQPTDSYVYDEFS